jgi:pimeloyl-ACP methyl ester carboxylesterase
MLTRTLAEGYCSVGRAIRDADFTDRTRALKVPTLCFVGAQDGATPPALVRELADLIEGAVYEQVEDCGHLPCIEQPEALAAAISGLLKDSGLV